MLNSLVSVVAIIGFVLPGFIAARVAAGQRAQPASITDLELVLRALGYALAIHGAFLASSWTSSLIDKVERAGSDWGQHRWEILAFAASVLMLAFLLGLAVGVALRALERGPMRARGKRGAVAVAAFHALGGQDARDAFDYVLERRREQDEQFIVVVRVEGTREDDEGLRAGLYGRRSYFGLSPRPHDLYLEEVWEFAGRGTLRKKRPAHEAWFPATEIKDLWFRPITDAEVERGEVRDFRRRTLSEALELDRGRVINEILIEASKVEAPTTGKLAAAIDRLHKRFEELEAADAGYDEWTGWRGDILAAASIAAALIPQADPELELSSPGVNTSVRTRMRAFSLTPGNWDQWLLNLDYYIQKVASAPEDEQYLLLDLTGYLAAGMWRVEGFEPEWWEGFDGPGGEFASTGEG